MRTVYTLMLLFATTFAGAQDFALKQLEASPRHQEWVNVEYGGRKVRAFVVFEGDLSCGCFLPEIVGECA